MKKIVIISIFLIFILVVSLIGYFLISDNELLESKIDTISYQFNLEENFDSYGYTSEKPNIILNPYEISPLTALIIFETKEEVSPLITIRGKDENTTYSYSAKKGKVHYLPIYGLYANYNNKVTISYDNKTYDYYIQTPLIKQKNVPDNLPLDNKLLFTSTDKESFAYDKNGDLRWLLLKGYVGQITMLDNSHIILSNNSLIDDTNHTGFIEMDLLGKIYYEYILPNGYANLNTVLKSNNILALSNNILEIDNQNGQIIKKFNINNTNSWNNLFYDLTSNKIILSNNTENFKIDYKSKKMEDDNNLLVLNNNYIFTNSNYKLGKAITFGKLKITPITPEKVFIFQDKSVKQLDENYNFKLIREKNRLVVKGNFNKDDKVYIILDKFLNKKVYKFDTKKNHLYINNTSLKGNYPIYLKINDTIYKTNKYIKF